MSEQLDPAAARPVNERALSREHGPVQCPPFNALYPTEETADDDDRTPRQALRRFLERASERARRRRESR